MEHLPSNSNAEHKTEGVSNQMAITQMEEDVLIFPKLLNLLLFTRILFLLSLHPFIKLVVITIFHMVNKFSKKLSMLNRDMENIKKIQKTPNQNPRA